MSNVGVGTAVLAWFIAGVGRQTTVRVGSGTELLVLVGWGLSAGGTFVSVSKMTCRVGVLGKGVRDGVISNAGVSDARPVTSDRNAVLDWQAAINKANITRKT